MIDELMGMKFDIQTSNCWHFTQKAWQKLMKEDLPDLTPTIASGGRIISQTAKYKKVYELLANPAPICLALMERAPWNPHIGVYYYGRIMHLTERGVQFVSPSVAKRGFEKVSYYLPCKT